MKRTILSLAIALSWLCATLASAAQPYNDSDRKAIATAMPNAKVSLADALKAGERHGTLSGDVVRIIPGVQNGKPVAEVTLAKDKDFRPVLQKLY